MRSIAMSVLEANPNQSVEAAEQLDPSIVEWIKVSITVVAALGLSLFFVLAIVFAPTTDSGAQSAASAANKSRTQLSLLQEAAMIDRAGGYGVDATACNSAAQKGAVQSVDCAESSPQRGSRRADLKLGYTD
jgi:hypothetical protein